MIIMVKNVRDSAHDVRISGNRFFLRQSQDVHIDDRNGVEEENRREAQLWKRSRRQKSAGQADITNVS